MMLGECQSKCEHLAGVPLRPDVAHELHAVYLAKGIAATTAIEGNTLSEEQVRRHLEGDLTVAPSKEYQKQEIDNILTGCNTILHDLAAGRGAEISPDRIRQLNRIVLNGLVLTNEQAVAGEFRQHSVGVMDYRGAPWEDCAYLIDRLCVWLNELKPVGPGPGQEIVMAILKAILAHLYIAWIHPFGDGNGRTARLLEVQILLGSGVPAPAAQLMSNHYNQTRTEYYRQLGLASKTGAAEGFIRYAVEGLRDNLVEQIARVRSLQWDIAWQNYLHEALSGGSPVAERRKSLLIALSRQPAPVAHDALLNTLPGDVVQRYARKTPKTLTRDLVALMHDNLIRREPKGYVANRELILAFLPFRAAPDRAQG
jgi:Fic family protein